MQCTSAFKQLCTIWAISQRSNEESTWDVFLNSTEGDAMCAGHLLAAIFTTVFFSILMKFLVVKNTHMCYLRKA